MIISEAIRARTENKPYITREAWCNTYRGSDLKVFPTNTPDCCVLTSLEARGPRRGWQPTAGDLIADDWFVTD